MIKVLIWENRWGPMAMKHPGHAAVAVMHGAHPADYVSWWPESGKNTPPPAGQNYRTGKAKSITEDFIAELGSNARAALDGGAAPRRGQLQDTTDFYTDHRVYVDNPHNDWMQAPTQVIHIQTCDDVEDLGNGNQRLGLHENNLMDWWHLYKTSVINPQQRREYDFVSKKFNCASVAMAALLAAGGDMFEKPSKAWIYYSPNDIRDYAIKLRRKIERINTQAQAVQNGILSEFRRYMPESRQKFGVDYLHSSGANSTRIVEIWRPEEWRTQSAVMIGRRKEQVAAIDEAMEQYWALGTGWTDSNFLNKALFLSEILSNVQSHLIEKPNSDRRQAVLKLGSQCIAVIRYHAARGQAQRDDLMNTVGFLF